MPLIYYPVGSVVESIYKETVQSYPASGALGAQIICETSTREPGEAPPHRIGDSLYLFRRGDIAFQYSCIPTTVELRETPLCYADAYVVLMTIVI